MDVKKFYSNNCVKVSNTCYNSKYCIVIRDNKLWTLKEYDKNKDDYKEVKSSFNEWAFLDYLEKNKIRKYFSERDNQILGIEV